VKTYWPGVVAAPPKVKLPTESDAFTNESPGGKLDPSATVIK